MSRSALSACLLLAVSQLAACKQPKYDTVALVNADFDQPAVAGVPVPAWTLSQHAGPPSYDFAIDTQSPAQGNSSLRIRQTQPQVYGAVGQIVPLKNAEKRSLRLRAKVKTGDVGADGWCLQIDFRNGSGVIDTIKSKPVTGTKGWRDVMIEGPVPIGTVEVGVTAILEGGGTAWLDDVHLELRQATP
jgi:hypothetical protein